LIKLKKKSQSHAERKLKNMLKENKDSLKDQL